MSGLLARRAARPTPGSVQAVPGGSGLRPARPALVYVNGAMVPWAEATIHVSSVAAKYGANVVEGVCAYAGDGGESWVLRLR